MLWQRAVTNRLLSLHTNITAARGITSMSLHSRDCQSEAKRPRLDLESTKNDDGSSSSSSSSVVATKVIPGSLNDKRLNEVSEENKALQDILSSNHLPKSTANINFHEGLFLAPMVRIGSLPTRLLCLQYGADLVWSPEIVDRAIIGSDRIVDARTGMVSFLREGKQILTTHPIERDRMIFQLGSSSPEWAYKAISLVTSHNDVAGVDLNCGCPKPFSTIGGMGAQLLSTPDLLCSILRAMRKAAPPHISVTCKIRLLPTKEATQSLVRQIIQTGTIDALTVHCRTKDMRPREKALTSRFEEVRQVVEEETNGKLPLICNGDAWNADEAYKIMKATGIKSVMIARGAEGNPSCFRPQGVLSVPEIIAPAWIRLALTFENNHGNSKYCINSMAFKPSSSIVPNAQPIKSSVWNNKQKFQEVRSKISQAKTVEELAVALQVNVEAQKSMSVEDALKDIREALTTKLQDSHEENSLLPKDLANDSGNELADTEARELSTNVV